MKRFLLFVMLLIIGLAVLPAFAQDSAPASAPLDSATVTLSVWQIIVGIGSAIALGGIGGVAGVGVLASRLRHDAAAMAAIEKLGDSVPPSQSQVIVAITERFTTSLNEVTSLVVEALDRIPAASKPQEAPTTTNNVTLPPAEPAPPAKQDW